MRQHSARFRDETARVREQAARLALASGRQIELAGDLAALAEDPDARVRLRAAVALSGNQSDVAETALARIAARDAESPWTAAAILNAVAPRPLRFLDVLAAREPGWLTDTSPQQALFLVRLGELIGAGREEGCRFSDRDGLDPCRTRGLRSDRGAGRGPVADRSARTGASAGLASRRTRRSTSARRSKPLARRLPR